MWLTGKRGKVDGGGGRLNRVKLEVNDMGLARNSG